MKVWTKVRESPSNYVTHSCHVARHSVFLCKQNLRSYFDLKNFSTHSFATVRLFCLANVGYFMGAITEREPGWKSNNVLLSHEVQLWPVLRREKYERIIKMVEPGQTVRQGSQLRLPMVESSIVSGTIVLLLASLRVKVISHSSEIVKQSYNHFCNKFVN